MGLLGFRSMEFRIIRFKFCKYRQGNGLEASGAIMPGINVSRHAMTCT